jgi:mono/diheme cytochrome c family protein
MKFRFAAAAVLGLTAFGLSFSALRAQATKSVWDGVYSDAQARDGAELYGQQCASCHGDTLAGGEEAPPLAGGDFLSNWNGLTAGDLFERIRTTMPLSKPQSLSREVNAKILAYIFSVNKFPAGKTDMPLQTEILKGIQIQSSKP